MKRRKQIKVLAIVLAVILVIQSVDFQNVNAKTASEGEAGYLNEYEKLINEEEISKEEVLTYSKKHESIYNKISKETVDLANRCGDWMYVAQNTCNWPTNGGKLIEPDEIYKTDKLYNGLYSAEIRKHHFLTAIGESSTITSTTMATGSTNIGYGTKHFVGGELAFCSDHWKDSLAAGTTVTAVNPGLNDSIINNMKKILYYGYGGAQSIVGSTVDDFLLTEFALSYAKGTYPDAGSKTIAYYNNLISKSLPTDVEITLTFWSSGNSNQQQLVTISTQKKPEVVMFYSNLKFVKVSDFTDRSVGQASGQAEYYIYEYSKYDKQYHKCCRVNYNGDTSTNRTNHNVYSLSSNIQKTQYGWNNGALVVLTDISYTTSHNSRLYYTDYNEGKFRLVEEKAPNGYNVSAPVDFSIPSDKNSVIDLSSTWNISTMNDGKVVDVPWYCNVKFNKYDAITKDIISGAKFVVDENIGTGTTDRWVKVADVHFNGTSKDLTDINNEYSLNISGTAQYHGTEGTVIVTVPANSSGTFKSSRLYYTEYNQGRFRIRETQAPEGYSLAAPFVWKMKRNAQVVETKINENPKGSIYVTKRDVFDGTPVKGATFELRDITGLTDKELENLSAGELIDEWITTEEGHTVMDSSGTKQLPAGTYRIVETNAPIDEKTGKQYLLADPYIFVRESSTDSNNIDILEYPEPEISTVAIDSETLTHTGCNNKKVTIVDTVSYVGAKPGELLELTGTLVYADSGEKVDVSEIKTNVEAEEDGEGKVEMRYSVDYDKVEGRDVVVTVSLIEGNVTVEHDSLTNLNQTVSYPSIKTKVADRQGYASVNETIIDTVTLTNLVEGESYTLIAKLYNRTNNSFIKDSENNDIESKEVSFVYKGQQTENVSITYNSIDLKGDSVIVYEYLYVNGVCVSQHTEDDVNQRIDYPDLKTKAADYETGNHQGVVTEKARIIDKCYVSNLIVGKEYTVEGTLKNKENGETVVDGTGKEVTGKTTFVAESENMEVEVEFELDSSVLAGKKTVCFETLKYDDIELVSEIDLQNEEQEVDYPDLKTKAADYETGNHQGVVSEKARIIDKCYVSNLIVGKEYTVEGTLKNKETGETVIDGSGKEVTGKTTFIAESENMEVEVEFELDSSVLEGKKTVCFESLSYEDIVVVAEEDLLNEDQEIEYPMNPPEETTTPEEITSETETTTEIETTKKTSPPEVTTEEETTTPERTTYENPPKTGDNTMIGKILLFMIVISGLVIILARKKKI